MDFFKNIDNITKRKLILTIIIAAIIVAIIAIVIETVNSLGKNLYFLAFLAPLLSILFVNYYPNREIGGFGEQQSGGFL